MKILVTGGAGFIGSHLCADLLTQGNEVICLDNFYTGSKRNVWPLINNPNFEIIRHDITFPIYLEVDQIYNLACPASPIHYQNYPIQTTKTSVIGAINVLGMAKRLKIPILQASTSEVYGDPTEHPQTEDYWGNVNPIGPRSCYDEGKRCAEALFYDYARQEKVNVRVARIFNTYGPNMSLNDGRMVSNFITQALQNQPITIYGDGTQTRSLCYVSDLVRGLIELMNHENAGEMIANRPMLPVNLGNPYELDVLTVARRIIEMTESESTTIHSPLPTDDPKQRCPDISRAQKELNWGPAVQLGEGLEQTIKYFIKELESRETNKNQTQFAEM